MQLRETSIAAGRSFNASGDKYDHHRKILAALDFSEGTNLEISNRCGLSYHQTARRISELVAENKVYDTGMVGKSPSGKKAIVWAKVN